MNEQRTLLVGLDLCGDYTQISFFNQKTVEPESLCVSTDSNKYLIPTVLGVKKDSKEWMIGEDALTLHKLDTGVIVEDLLSCVEKKQTMEILGVLFEPNALLEKFLKKSLQLLKMQFATQSILKIVVTLKDISDILAEGVYKALNNLGVGADRAIVMSHSQSYQYYALSQSKELWMNDVSLFDFDECGLKYQQISINRKIHPFLVGIMEKDYSQTLSYDMLSELKNNENLEYIFENIAKSILHKQIVSTVYVTGKGFDGNWSDNVLKELCVGRRVFKGQNLYVKGACYAAKEMSGDRKLGDYLLLSQEMLTSTLTITAYTNAKFSEVILAKAATPWYEVNDKIDLILEEQGDILVTINNVIKGETTHHIVELDGLPNRPNRTTRIELRIKFLDRTTANIIIKDMGFGDFYPSSNRIWEETITI